MSEPTGRYIFIETDSIVEAALSAPWAKILYEVNKGFRAYERLSDFLAWFESW